ncbi:MAG: SGNH/GDSL hydrolase family protein [bacterium]|nr:SGNH/GDSL hydrolase family protein [bacterium]
MHGIVRLFAVLLMGSLVTAYPSAPAFAQATPAFGPDYPMPKFGSFDPARLDGIDPADAPILPTLTDHARIIFERGQARGVLRDVRMFSKVGDSMTASASFLVPFGDGAYDLGEYTDLQAVIDHFRYSGTAAPGVLAAPNAFNRENYANAVGFSTASALDSTWAVADVCEPNETPLACEFRIGSPAFALIMFGTNDVMAFDAALFDFFLRQVVLETAAADVVPVLYTFPPRPEAPEQSAVFNQIILSIAADYDLPVINLVRALEPLPDYGVDLNDTLHLTNPELPATAATFTDAGLAAGYTVRNLITLQALDGLLRELGVLDEPALN